MIFLNIITLFTIAYYNYKRMVNWLKFSGLSSCPKDGCVNPMREGLGFANSHPRRIIPNAPWVSPWFRSHSASLLSIQSPCWGTSTLILPSDFLGGEGWSGYQPAHSCIPLPSAPQVGPQPGFGGRRRYHADRRCAINRNQYTPEFY